MESTSVPICISIVLFKRWKERCKTLFWLFSNFVHILDDLESHLHPKQLEALETLLKSLSGAWISISYYNRLFLDESFNQFLNDSQPLVPLNPTKIAWRTFEQSDPNLLWSLLPFDKSRGHSFQPMFLLLFESIWPLGDLSKVMCPTIRKISSILLEFKDSTLISILKKSIALEMIAHLDELVWLFQLFFETTSVRCLKREDVPSDRSVYCRVLNTCSNKNIKFDQNMFEAFQELWTEGNKYNWIIDTISCRSEGNMEIKTVISYSLDRNSFFNNNSISEIIQKQQTLSLSKTTETTMETIFQHVRKYQLNFQRMCVPERKETLSQSFSSNDFENASTFLQWAYGNLLQSFVSVDPSNKFPLKTKLSKLLDRYNSTAPKIPSKCFSIVKDAVLPVWKVLDSLPFHSFSIRIPLDGKPVSKYVSICPFNGFCLSDLPCMPLDLTIKMKTLYFILNLCFKSMDMELWKTFIENQISMLKNNDTKVDDTSQNELRRVFCKLRKNLEKKLGALNPKLCNFQSNMEVISSETGSSWLPNSIPNPTQSKDPFLILVLLSLICSGASIRSSAFSAIFFKFYQWIVQDVIQKIPKTSSQWNPVFFPRHLLAIILDGNTFEKVETLWKPLEENIKQDLETKCKFFDRTPAFMVSWMDKLKTSKKVRIQTDTWIQSYPMNPIAKRKNCWKNAIKTEFYVLEICGKEVVRFWSQDYSEIQQLEKQLQEVILQIIEHAALIELHTAFLKPSMSKRILDHLKNVDHRYQPVIDRLLGESERWEATPESKPLKLDFSFSTSIQLKDEEPTHAIIHGKFIPKTLQLWLDFDVHHLPAHVAKTISSTVTSFEEQSFASFVKGLGTESLDNLEDRYANAFLAPWDIPFEKASDLFQMIKQNME